MAGVYIYANSNIANMEMNYKANNKKSVKIFIKKPLSIQEIGVANLLTTNY